MIFCAISMTLLTNLVAIPYCILVQLRVNCLKSPTQGPRKVCDTPCVLPMNVLLLVSLLNVMANLLVNTYLVISNICSLLKVAPFHCISFRYHCLLTYTNSTASSGLPGSMHAYTCLVFFCIMLLHKYYSMLSSIL